MNPNFFQNKKRSKSNLSSRSDKELEKKKYDIEKSIKKIIRVECDCCHREIMVDNDYCRKTGKVSCRTPECPREYNYNDLVYKYFLKNSLTVMNKLDINFHGLNEAFNSIKSGIENRRYLQVYEWIKRYHCDLIFMCYYMLSGENVLPSNLHEMEQYFKNKQQLTIFDMTE